MDRIIKGEVITLDNDLDYVTVESVEQGGKIYLYLVREDGNEVIVAEEVHEGEEIFVDTVTDLNKIMGITNIVMERVKQ